jgi:hypothetical protein
MEKRLDYIGYIQVRKTDTTVNLAFEKINVE